MLLLNPTDRQHRRSREDLYLAEQLAGISGYCCQATAGLILRMLALVPRWWQC